MSERSSCGSSTSASGVCAGLGKGLVARGQAVRPSASVARPVVSTRHARAGNGTRLVETTIASRSVATDGLRMNLAVVAGAWGLPARAFDAVTRVSELAGPAATQVLAWSVWMPLKHLDILSSAGSSALLLELRHANSGQGRDGMMLGLVVMDLVNRDRGMSDVGHNGLLVDHRLN